MSVDDETYGSDSFEADETDFVPAFFARDLDEAEEYCDLLSDHDIPARAGADSGLPDSEEAEQQLAGQRGMTHGVPVLVPESLLDEASEVIADREDFPDYDDEEDEEDEDDDELELAELDEDDADDDYIDEEEDDDPFEDADDLDDLERDEGGFY